jgi:hypothetical protein
MKKGILAIICTCLLIPAAGFADNNMRDYIAAPPNTLLSLLYYHHITGDELYADGDKAADIDLTEDLFLLREVYYFNMGSHLANAQVIIPFGEASLEAGPTDDSSSGIGDIILLGTFWFVSDDKTKTYFAFSPYFFLPTGDYDDNRIINMGGNRWAFREEFNFTKGWEVRPDHNLYFEVTTGVDFFADNDEYQGNDELSQDPLFNLESHLSYDLTKNLAVSFDYYGHWGGDSDVNDVHQDASINTQTIGGTVTYGFAPGWQLLLQYREDVKVDNGVEAEVIQARIFYATDFGKLFH